MVSYKHHVGCTRLHEQPVAGHRTEQYPELWVRWKAWSLLSCSAEQKFARFQKHMLFCTMDLGLKWPCDFIGTLCVR